MGLGELQDLAVFGSYDRTVFFSIQQEIEYWNIESLCNLAQRCDRRFCHIPFNLTQEAGSQSGQSRELAKALASLFSFCAYSLTKQVSFLLEQIRRLDLKVVSSSSTDGSTSMGGGAARWALTMSFSPFPLISLL